MRMCLGMHACMPVCALLMWDDSIGGTVRRVVIYFFHRSHIFGLFSPLFFSLSLSLFFCPPPLLPPPPLFCDAPQAFSPLFPFFFMCEFHHLSLTLLPSFLSLVCAAWLRALRIVLLCRPLSLPIERKKQHAVSNRLMHTPKAAGLMRSWG